MSTPPESAPPSTAGEPLLTLRGLAKAIGVDAGQLSKESGRPGFPAHQTEQGILYDRSEVTQWRQVNVRRRKSASPAVEPSPALAVPAARPQRRDSPPSTARPTSPPPAMLPGDNADTDLLAILQSGTASALEITRATMQIASRRVARAHRENILGPNDLDGLKKSLQELRTAEAGYLELAEKSGQLIPRDQVRAIVSDCCQRLVRVAASIENALALEFAAWLADPKVAAMGADERARHIRAYVSQATRAARIQEADAIDALINQPRTT